MATAILCDNYITGNKEKKIIVRIFLHKLMSKTI